MERVSGQLTAAEICGIIEAGKKFGCRSVTVTKDIIRVKYAVIKDSEPTWGSLLDLSKKQVVPEVGAANKSMELEVAELRRQDEIEQIKILDPLKYEQMLADGDIEDVHDEQDP